MGGKSGSSSRDYAKGHDDGASGKPHASVGIVATILDQVIPGPSIQPSKDYTKGYKDGKSDKNR